MCEPIVGNPCDVKPHSEFILVIKNGRANAELSNSRELEVED